MLAELFCLHAIALLASPPPWGGRISTAMLFLAVFHWDIDVLGMEVEMPKKQIPPSPLPSPSCPKNIAAEMHGEGKGVGFQLAVIGIGA